MKINAMSKFHRLFYASAALIVMAGMFIACDQPRLFDNKESARANNQSPLKGSNNDPVITMAISGGIAGVSKYLVIDSNGFVSYTDDRTGTGYTDYLTAAEYADLIAKFVAADFFHLKDTYLTEGAADLFFYDITFRQNGVSHRVLTDHLTSPRSLQEIVEALERIINDVATNRLQLALKADRDSFKAGESVKLSLEVANLSNAAVTLNFADGQVYDFYAVTAGNASLRAPAREWNWAHNKVFTQATQTITFAAGQRATYEIEWSGRDNNGQQLLGAVLVAAELVSVPGGSTGLLPLQILN